MGTAACGRRGFKERTRVSGERRIGAARCSQQYNRASYQPPPPPSQSVGGCVGQGKSTTGLRLASPDAPSVAQP